jgi:glyoxylase-like metal-dependent hydrolase (beta-lactamase superfamily II)/rhodanese-related sulfurtransferase
MNVEYRQLNPHSCRSYLISSADSREAYLIDPVLEHFTDYVDLIQEERLDLRAVVDTHTHADHISACAALKDRFGCIYAMHGNARAECADRRVEDGETRTVLGDISVTVWHTPGHTQDSVCIILPDRIFTGDTLFLDDGGAGRDDLPGGDAAAHWESLKRLSELPDDLVVYPAHDYRDREPSSLGRQRHSNPHMKERTKDEFVGYLEELKLGPADWMKDVLKANYSCAQDPNAAWIPVDAPACEVKGTLDEGVNEISVGPISAEDLRTRLDSGDAPFLLDVRELAELQGPMGHLENIVHIPIGDLSHRLSELDEEKNSDVVVVCLSGGRAHTAAQIMKAAGFASVRVLEGGMIAWNAL